METHAILKKMIVPAISIAVSVSRMLQAASSDRDLQIVAHEDDDVIFINPDIQNSINAGDIVRTVFVTSGNLNPNGTDVSYWQAREWGILAAYATMAGKITAPIQSAAAFSYASFASLYTFTSCQLPGSCGILPRTIDVWTLNAPMFRAKSLCPS